VKLSWAGILALVIDRGGGGYGSSMGMTTAPGPAISPASVTCPTPLTVSIQDSPQGTTIYHHAIGEDCCSTDTQPAQELSPIAPCNETPELIAG